jgi:hypothetical protein
MADPGSGPVFPPRCPRVPVGRPREKNSPRKIAAILADWHSWAVAGKTGPDRTLT